MDWNVKNAVNRDVERQHLNKILKEIKGGQDDIDNRLTAATGALGNVQNSLNSTVINIINQTLTPGSLATSVTLNGDVIGTSVPVTGQNAVTIQTTLTKTYLEDAPSDLFAYWRRSGNWEQVSIIIDGLNLMFDQGIMVWNSDDLAWYARSIETADVDRLTVTNGAGLAGNPTLDLALVPDDGTGVLQRTSFDAWGRKIGTAAATTDDLPEGVTNLYFTDARAVAALEDTGPDYLQLLLDEYNP